MEYLSLIVTFIAEITVLAGVIIPVWVALKKIKEGIKCQHRSEMRRIYYLNRETKKIRQYEFEDFMHHHASYKALGGNSFIDKIHSEITDEWEIIP